ECRPTRRYTLFPYTTLFRSWGYTCVRQSLARTAARLPSTARSTRAARLPLHCSRSANWPKPARAVKRRTTPVMHTAGLKTTHYRSEEHTSELQSRENLVCRL